jgi:hypothetical protein
VAIPAVAGTWTPNNFLYMPSLGAKGEAEKNSFDTGLERVDKRLGNEIWVGDPKYGSTLPAAVSAIGGNQVALGVPAGTYNITADLTIPANITLKPERGALLAVATTKTLTVNGGLEAGLHQIFSCTGTGKVVFGSGSIKEYYPQWSGAKGDGVTNDAAAINAAAANCRASFDAGQTITLTFVPGIYLANSALDLSGCSVNMLPKAVIRSGITSGAAVTVGETDWTRINYQQDQRNYGKTLILEVEQNGTFNPASGHPVYGFPAGTTGILIKHYDRSDCTIRRCAGFETGVKLGAAYGAGIAYSKFYLGYLQNNVNILFDVTGSTVESVNTFYGGSFNCPPTGSQFIGIKFVNGSTTAHMINNNIFYAPTFELGQPGGGKYSYCVWFDDAVIGEVGCITNNKIYDAYIEATDFGVRFGNYTANNIFEAAYISVTGFTLAVPASTSPAYDQNYAYYKPAMMKEWGKVLVCQKWLTGGHKDVEGYYWPVGLSCFDYTLTPKFPTEKALSPNFGVDYVAGYAANAFGTFVETYKFKTFRMEISALSGYNPGRVFVKCFDANFVELTGSSPNYVGSEYITNMPSDGGITWDTDWGNYRGVGYTDDFLHLAFRSEVKYAWIGVGGGDPNVRATGFSIWAFLPETERLMTAPFHATRVTAPKAFAFPAGFQAPTQ